MVSQVTVKKALPTITSPRKEGPTQGSPLSTQGNRKLIQNNDNVCLNLPDISHIEEIGRLKKELEEEKKKNAHLEVNLASQAKAIKSLELQLAKEKSELEFLKSKIATAIVRKVV